MFDRLVEGAAGRLLRSSVLLRCGRLWGSAKGGFEGGFGQMNSCAKKGLPGADFQEIAGYYGAKLRYFWRISSGMMCKWLGGRRLEGGKQKLESRKQKSEVRGWGKGRTLKPEHRTQKQGVWTGLRFESEDGTLDLRAENAEGAEPDSGLLRLRRLRAKRGQAPALQNGRLTVAAGAGGVQIFGTRS